MSHLFKCLVFLMTVQFTTVSLAEPNEPSQGTENDVQKVRVWSYYLAPPFQASNGHQGIGVSKAFLALLNQYFSGRVTFYLEEVPRARLNRYLERDEQGLVLFVNPSWMERDADTRYLWTSAVLKDQNEIISSVRSKVEYTTPSSLTGLRFGTIRGRKYSQFSEVFQSGAVTRIMVDREDQALSMLNARRVDITTQPRTTALALIEKLGLQGKLYFSEQPLFKFTRHIMITKSLSHLHGDLEAFVQQLPTDPNWQKILDMYQVNSTKMKSTKELGVTE